jgi:hypothetical protein
VPPPEPPSTEPEPRAQLQSEQRPKQAAVPANNPPATDDGCQDAVGVGAGGRPELQIDAEFAALLPEQSPGELAQLEANLVADGVCHEALIVWKGHNLLLDGHNRLRFCKRHGIPYRVVEIDLPDRESAKRWIILHQLGRRNLPPDQAAYLRGKLFNQVKKPHGGDRRSEKSKPHSEVLISTAAELAPQLGVAPATLNRDGQFAEAVDRIEAACGREAKRELLAGKVSRTEVIALARLGPEPLKKAAKELLAGKAGTPKAGTLSKEQKAKAPKPGARSGKPPATITLPAKPAAFAAALKEQLSPEKALQICLALCRAFGLEVKEGPPQQTTPPTNRPKKSGGKAAAKSKSSRGTHKSKARS